MLIRKKFIHFGQYKDYSIDYLSGILEDARTTTLQRISEISINELHWQFQPEWNSIGALLSHIISSDHIFRIEFLENRELTANESKRWLPGSKMGKYLPQLITDQDVNHYIDLMANSRSRIMNCLTKLSSSDFHKRREGYGSENGFNVAWALYHLAEDEVHHRGQISIIRKLYKIK